jgi:hypothetical protein
MGLMHLLTVGRSLSEAREQPHRYKLKNRGLPKFGKTGSSAVIGTGDFEAGKPLPLGGEVGRERAAGKPMNTEAVAEQMVQSARDNPFPRGRWTLNPFRGEKPVPRPAIQGELSLDKVKPVRNDLSDSDLELVAAAKPQPVPATVKIESEEVPIVKRRPIWSRVLALFQRPN